MCFKDVQHVNYEVAESPKEVTNYLAGAQDFSQLSDEEFENILFLFDWQVFFTKLAILIIGLNISAIDMQHYTEKFIILRSALNSLNFLPPYS